MTQEFRVVMRNLNTGKDSTGGYLYDTRKKAEETASNLNLQIQEMTDPGTYPYEYRVIEVDEFGNPVKSISAAEIARVKSFAQWLENKVDEAEDGWVVASIPVEDINRLAEFVRKIEEGAA